jgi:hypothetical protein
MLALAIVGGCAYYEPHSLVATNMRTDYPEPLVRGPTRVEAQVCGSRFVGIPFGPDPTMDAFVEALEGKAKNTVGFEDIRIDHLLISYLFIFSKDCVHGSALPLFSEGNGRGTKRRHSLAPVPETAEPSPEAPPTPNSGTPEQPADPFAQ